MPITTSPYQNNDYQAASSYRPYRLPVNDIVRGLEAQNKFWDDGARMVKAYYDNALDLDLTLDENKVIRKDFMQNAEKEIAKLSTMNLADPTVQRKGKGIFSPLFKDEGIMYDDFLTKKQREIFSEAERYKRDEKTKGEGYHSDNLQYALRAFQGFNSAASRNDLKTIANKAKNAEYIPYHDVSKEYMDIASKCKPNKMSGNSVQGLYFQESTDNSLDASKLNACIKSGMSDKAWQQLRITGTVRLGDDYGSIAQGYAPILESTNQSYSQSIIGLAAERKKLKDTGEMTDELDQAYEQQIGRLKSAITSNNASLGRIQGGDYSDIEKNYDNIVSQVWANQDIGGFAEAFAYKDKVEKWSANAAGIAQMREAGENTRFGATLQWNQQKFGMEMQMKEKENDIKLLESLMGGKNGGGISANGATYQMLAPLLAKLGIDPNVTTFLDEGVKIEGVGETYESIQNKTNQFHHERIQSAEGMYEVLKEVVGPEGLDALEKRVRGNGGSLMTEEVYGLADEYLSTYHKSGGKKSPLSGKVDAISDLERLSNQYSNARSKVWEFMKIRDQIDKEIESNPELKSKKLEFEKQSKDLAKKYGDSIQRFWVSTASGYKAVIEQSDLEQLMNGTHPELMFASKVGDGYNDTGLIYRRTGETVKQGGFDVQAIEKRTGKEFYFDASGFQKYHKIHNQRKEALQPSLHTIIKDVVRNSNVHNVANVPGLGNSMKQEFTFLQEFNSGEFEFRPGVSFKDGQGNPVTTVKVYKKQKIKDDDTDATNMESTEVTGEVMAALKKSNYSLGGAGSTIGMVDGQLTVKTPYLPIWQNQNDFTEIVSNQVYAATRKPIGYQKKVSSEVKRIPGSGGFRIGFDIVGGGTSYQGSTNPNAFKVWYMLPNGEKEYFGGDVFAENQVSNQLGILEKSMGQIVDAYNKKHNK